MQGKVIYQQIMTPIWLEAYASYIENWRTLTSKQLTFNAGSVNDTALLKVPMIPAGSLSSTSRLTVEITVANGINIGSFNDGDINYGVSDGSKFVGFHIPKMNHYVSPCFGMEGLSGVTISSTRYDPYSDDPRRPYSAQFVFILKLDERWDSCYTARDEGFVNTAVYNNRLIINKGLTLEVYKGDSGVRIGITFIKVAIIQYDA